MGLKTPDGGVIWDGLEAKSQIKSADAITRDSDGNVIPLSQRFNDKDDRITFSNAKP